MLCNRQFGTGVVDGCTGSIAVEESGREGGVDKGVGVAFGEHVAAPFEFGMGNFHLCQQGGGNVTLVHQHIHPPRGFDGTAQPQHGGVEVALVLVRLAVKVAMVGDDD